MKIFTFFLFILSLFLSLNIVYADFQSFLVIDDFEYPTPSLLVTILPGGSLPEDSVSTQIDDVLGGERDLIIITEDGQIGSTMSAKVEGGSWISSSPQQASGYSSLQYDGLEGSNNINHNGLDCVDLTVGGLADGFLLQAQANTPTDFKFLVYGFFGGFASASKQVTDNQATYYYIEFNTFNGYDSVDFTCVGAIEITATIPTFSQFLVDTLVVGTYIPESPSYTPTPSCTPSETSSISETPTSTPTPSRVPSSGIIGPVTPSTQPTMYHECESSDDCLYLGNQCTVVACVNFMCETQPYLAPDGCCEVASDCPQRECTQVGCSSSYMCVYTPIGCIDSNSHMISSNEEPTNSTGGNGWIAGVVLGAVGFVCIALVVLVIIFIVIKKRKSNTNTTSVYDAMISDM